MTTAEIVNAFINGAVAFGTLLLAGLALFLAVFGDWLKGKMMGPRLRLELDNPKGGMFPCSNGSQRICYGLKVVNDRPSATATNCRVEVKNLWRLMPDGKYVPLPNYYPVWLTWSPSEFTPPTVSVKREQLVDFGFVEEGTPFMPSVRVRPFAFHGEVKSEETIRYSIEIVSDQFVSKEPQLFEVSWDGEWRKNLDDMAGHLKIREVRS